MLWVLHPIDYLYLRISPIDNRNRDMRNNLSLQILCDERGTLPRIRNDGEKP